MRRRSLKIGCIQMNIFCHIRPAIRPISLKQTRSICMTFRKSFSNIKSCINVEVIKKKIYHKLSYVLTIWLYWPCHRTSTQSGAIDFYFSLKSIYIIMNFVGHLSTVVKKLLYFCLHILKLLLKIE